MLLVSQLKYVLASEVGLITTAAKPMQIWQVLIGHDALRSQAPAIESAFLLP